jgi:hypothetical protein
MTYAIRVCDEVDVCQVFPVSLICLTMVLKPVDATLSGGEQDGAGIVSSPFDLFNLLPDTGDDAVWDDGADGWDTDSGDSSWDDTDDSSWLT